MNNQPLMNASEPQPSGRWVDAYMPDGAVIPSQENRQFISFASIRGILFRQRWLFAGVLFFAIVAGVIVTLLATPMYLAESKVKVEPYGTFVLEGQDVESTIASNQVYDYLATQVEVIKSRSLAEFIAADLNLGERSDLLGRDVDEGRPSGMSDPEWTKAKQQMAASILVGSVTAEVPQENWVIRIGYNSESPTLAAEIANAYADAFVASGTRASADDNEYAVNYLQEEISQVRTRLEEAEQVANSYARGTGIIVQPSADGETSSSLTAINLANINQRYADARAARIDAEQRWRLVQTIPAAQLPEVQANSGLQGILAERTTKTAQLAELRQRYNDDFPQIVNLKAQIDILDRQIERTSADVKAGVRNAYNVALNQERALEAERASLAGATLNEKDQQVQLSVLERESQALRDQLKALLDRYNQVKSAANVNRGTLSKLDSATVPSSPYSPNLLKNLALAIVLGLASAAALAVLRETLDDRIRSLDEVEEKIGVPLLGHTPHVDENDIDTIGNNRFSALMEAYGSIRATIDFSLPRGRNLIQFTSTEAAEGKSTTAVILAELFAGMGRRTLLIDTDLRRPSVARLLDIERPKFGLVEVALGHARLEDAVVKGVHENLEILTVGAIPPNPTEILASREMREFVERCRNEYSLVIFDSCPMLGLADAAILANMVDATVFVLEANRVSFGQVRNAIKRLRQADGKVLGAVLTKYKALSAGESSKYEYQYYNYRSED